MKQSRAVSYSLNEPYETTAYMSVNLDMDESVVSRYLFLIQDVHIVLLMAITVNELFWKS